MRRPEVGLSEKSILNVNKGGVRNVNKLLSFSSLPCGCVGDGSSHLIKDIKIMFIRFYP